MVAWFCSPRGRAGCSGVLRRSRWAAVVAVVAVVPLLAGMRLPVPGGGQFGPAVPRPVRAARLVPVHPVRARKVAVPVMRRWRRPAVSWPAAGAATVTVAGGRGGAPRRAAGAALGAAGPSVGSARAGTMPVWVGPAAGGPARVAGVAPSRVREAAAAAGIKGVIVTLGRADGGVAAGQVHVSVDYASFAAAYGGDYAGRLR